MSDDTELTREEKAAFEALPREAAPSDLLEERIVRALRADGTLRSARGAGAASLRRQGDGVLGSDSRRVRPWIVAAVSMAASLILFGSGVAAGHWLAARSAERMVLAVRAQDERLVAQRVQEAGSAYVRALAALDALREGASSGARGSGAVPADRLAAELAQGGEAAYGTLYAATIELSRLHPDDPDLDRILQVLEGRRFAPGAGSQAPVSVWY